MSHEDLDWHRDGACLHRSAAADIVPALRSLFDRAGNWRGGRRVAGDPVLKPLVEGDLSRVAARHIGHPARPVRALLFDKRPDANWALGWHQDRTICVRDRRRVDGFGPWTVKQGLLHVAPPFDVIAGMATIRVHLDDVSVDNAPLLVAPGTHRIGRVAERSVEAAVRDPGVHTCLAKAGDIWAYATPILHASGRMRGQGRRRVLQVDYAIADLPGGLEWAGV